MNSWVFSLSEGYNKYFADKDKEIFWIDSPHVPEVRLPGVTDGYPTDPGMAWVRPAGCNGATVHDEATTMVAHTDLRSGNPVGRGFAVAEDFVSYDGTVAESRVVESPTGVSDGASRDWDRAIRCGHYRRHDPWHHRDFQSDFPNGMCRPDWRQTARCHCGWLDVPENSKTTIKRFAFKYDFNVIRSIILDISEVIKKSSIV